MEVTDQKDAENKGEHSKLEATIREWPQMAFIAELENGPAGQEDEQEGNKMAIRTGRCVDTGITELPG